MRAPQHSGECKKIFALLSEYLDLELAPDACRAIEEHLKDCAPCIEFAESLRKTIELCRQYSPGSAPAHLSDESRAVLEQAYRRMLGARQGSQEQADGIK
jgi:predicted anti-sigma-YlaC factor YlaD